MALQRRWLRVALVLATTAIVVFAGYTYWRPPIAEREIESSLFIKPQAGSHSYTVHFDVTPFWWLPSDWVRRAYEGNELRLFEDGKPLGLGHSRHIGIAEIGLGRYSYWRDNLYFSSSDNTDPRSNGRTYTVTYPRYVSPFVTSLAVVALLFGLLGLARSRQLVRWTAPRALATAFGLVLVIAPVEFFLRTDYARQELVGIKGPYDTFPKRLRPTLNSLGFRNFEHNREKPSGMTRILVLGDSLTFGHAVADDEIWPRHLKELAGSGVEVITMALNGWSTADQLRALRLHGLTFGPDIVVVGVVDNDLQPPQWDPSGFPDDWFIFTLLTRRLDLFRLLDYEINRFAARMGWRYTYSQWVKDMFDPSKRYWQAWLQTVADFRDELRRQGIPGYAIILTSPAGPSSEVSVKRYKTLARVFAKHGFRTVNLQPLFVKEFGPDGGKHLWALPNDPHPSPEVHRFYASEIWKVIQPVIRDRRAVIEPGTPQTR